MVDTQISSSVGEIFCSIAEANGYGCKNGCLQRQPRNNTITSADSRPQRDKSGRWGSETPTHVVQSQGLMQR
jgi:hypothetical protein